jgi:palmitoyltransferase ZDHHC9/14/18
MLKVTIAVPLVGCILLIMTVINYLKCAFTDPGFLPRSAPDETIFTEKINDITTDMSGYYYPSPKNKTIEIKNCEYEMRFCQTCKFYRPPRTVHCGTCNMCIGEEN